MRLLAGDVTADVRDLLPDTLDVADFGLATKLAFGTDFACDLLDFGSEDGQLVNHTVDSVDEIENLSGDGYASDLLRQVALCDRTLLKLELVQLHFNNTHTYCGLCDRSYL